jgi:YVTN family beta-propeller protein
MNMRRFVVIAGILIAVALLIHFPGRKLARAHVNGKTGVEDHPLLCTSCHVYISKNPVIKKLVNADYYSPYNLAVARDGKRLYVVAQEGNALLVVDTEKNKVVDKIGVGKMPYTVVINNDGKLAYVSNQWSDNVSVVDLEKATVVDTLTTGNGPAGMSFSADGNYLYVVNAFSSDISVIDLKSGEEQRRFTAGNNPTSAETSPDGKTILVTSRRAVIEPYGNPVRTELTIIDGIAQRVKEHRNMESAYLMENAAFTPSGDMAIVTLVRPKNLVPSIQVEQGWMMTYGIGIIEQKENGRIIQLLLDEPNAYYADPFDIVITPDGKKAFISNSGVNRISVVSLDSIRRMIANATPEMINDWPDNLGLSFSYVTGRIKTGANPKGMAVSPEGKLLYVAEQLEDRIAVFNTSSLETVGTIDLGGPDRITVARQGRRLFSNAGHTFQNQFSCYTCHPDFHEDGLVYNMASKDMGRNLTNTQSLRDIGDTAPYKWNGKNATVYKQDGIRFSTVLTRTEQFSYKDLDAIASYITRGIHYPPNIQNHPGQELTESQLRGKTIFERSVDFKGNSIPENGRCITCHPAPFYTNRQMFDVGTLASSDDSIKFDTPHLNNIFASAPYLHDGRAETLEEIWTKYGKEDKHGVVNDLSKEQLNDLIDYLKSLRAPEYDTKPAQIQKTSFIFH